MKRERDSDRLIIVVERVYGIKKNRWGKQT